MSGGPIPTLVSALGAVFDTSPTSTIVANPTGIVYANPACAQLFGYHRVEDLVGRSPFELITPAAREPLLELGRQRALGSAVPPHVPSRGLRRDGQEFALELDGMVELDGEHLLVMHRPVGDAPAPAVVVAEDHASLYRAVFEVNSAIKLLIDPATGAIVDANRAAVEFYGWSLETMRRMRVSDINTLTLDELRAEMRAAASGRRGYFRFRHRVASGQVRHVEVHSGPVALDDRQLLLSIIHDVTERDALEHHLRIAQRLEAVGRFAGSVAHEFNNLLTVTRTASEIVQRRLAPDSPLRRFASDIAYASARAAALTQELLAFSRRQHLRPRALDLNQVVGELGGVMQRTFGDAVALSVVLAPELPPVSGDPQQLEHVVMNLLVNARHASPPGGEIVLETALVEVAPQVLAGVPAGRWLTLRVRDRGHGMDEATQARIFEPMFTTKPEGQGTGLGMATVYGIVTQGGGHLTVDSAPGAGTTITAYLPLATGPVDGADAAPAAPTARDGHRAQRLLVVDDLEPIRRTLVSVLAELGYEANAAGSVDEALALVGPAADAFDAVVSDVQMPERSGFDLAEALHQRNPSLPVVLISGDLRGLDPSGLPGAPRLLAKPFSIQELSAAVRAVLPADA
ncbi:MAG: PAS domain S-box protein [Kofleriaceae bacterium]